MNRLFEVMEKLNPEFITEGIIQIPNEILSKIDGLYEYIRKNNQRLMTSAGSSYNSPYLDPNLKNFFMFSDLNNAPLNISVGIYNDEKDAGAGRMDTANDVLLINLPFFITNKADFKSMIEHELVHAKDPLVRTNNLWGAYYAKSGAEPDLNMSKYLKSQHEYNAFLTTLITTLKSGNIDAKWIINYFNYVKNYNGTVSDLYYDTPDDTKKYLSFNNSDDNAGYWSFLANYFDAIKSWGTKPTLYNDMAKKIYSELNK